MDFSKYRFEKGRHNARKIIKIIFPYHTQLINDLKKEMPTAKWSATLKCWHVPDNVFFREKFNLDEEGVVDFSYHTEIHPVNQSAFKQMYDQLKLKGYSKNTVRTYLGEFYQLLKVLKHHPVNDLTPERIRSYLLYCTDKLKLSENLIHSRLNAIKFYFEKVLGRKKFMFAIPRPKKHKQLPKVLSKQKVKQLFLKTENDKHRLMLKLCYGMGLRVSEIIKLKIEDIDSHRMQVHIVAAKGKKDRYVQLPESVLDDLRKYYKVYKPKIYLFEGQHGGQYSTRSAQSVFKQALRRVGVTKSVGIHSLRHSYATHLLEMGTDITFIQKLLGHNSIKTTAIYTNVRNSEVVKIKSPLDEL